LDMRKADGMKYFAINERALADIVEQLQKFRAA
jgi:hypothetical protein